MGSLLPGAESSKTTSTTAPTLPNLCALFVEEQRRRRGLARRLLDHARRQAADMGFDRLYLVTDHVGLYERCGWEYVGDVREEDGGLIRMYGVDVLDEGANCRADCMELRAEYL